MLRLEYYSIADPPPGSVTDQDRNMSRDPIPHSSLLTTEGTQRQRQHGSFEMALSCLREAVNGGEEWVIGVEGSGWNGMEGED